VSHDPLLGQTVSGRFLLEELVGQGGMGRVYKARHLGLHRPVALKLLKPAFLGDPTLVGRFEREAAAASRLHHPNVVSVLEFGSTGPDGTLFIAMEYVDGKDLRVVLRDEWPLPEARLCHLLAQVLSALGEAHARNVIHRDLKPENIMVAKRLDEGERVTVLDFGIAKILDGDLPALTRKDVVCGTPQYMAPEQATGAGLDARSDIYAVGVILYQLCTGRLPFDGPSAIDVLTQHVNDLPQAPRQRSPGASISEAMERLILRALEKDPARRPQSAEEFRRLLLAVAGNGAAVPAEGPPPPSPPPPVKGRPWAFLAALAAATRTALRRMAGLTTPPRRDRAG
jgi:eukaryotic-like serine/threonine-protein kinase